MIGLLVAFVSFNFSHRSSFFLTKWASWHHTSWDYCLNYYLGPIWTKHMNSNPLERSWECLNSFVDLNFWSPTTPLQIFEHRKWSCIVIIPSDATSLANKWILCKGASNTSKGGRVWCRREEEEPQEFRHPQGKVDLYVCLYELADYFDLNWYEGLPIGSTISLGGDVVILAKDIFI